MLSKVLATVNEYSMFNKKDKVVIGLSGGSDSVALFHALLALEKEFELEIFAVHINHGIRGLEADQDENFVKELCEKNSKQLFVYHINIAEEAQKQKITQEEVGRIFRYKSFDAVMKKCNGNKIAVAHNLNDSSETMILNFLRGTGLKGLTGIPPVRGAIVRPLIKIEKKEINEFCLKNNFQYITDNTNALPIYTRNKIRGQLVPYVEQEINTNIIKSLSRMAEIFSEEEIYLEEQACDAFKDVSVYNENNNILEISIERLNFYPNAIKKRILRQSISSLLPHLKNISHEHINMVEDLGNKKRGSKINLPFGLVCKRSFETIIMFKDNLPFKNYCYDIKINKNIYINEIEKYLLISSEKIPEYANYLYTTIYNCDIMENGLKFRVYNARDKIFFKSIGGNKYVKDFLRDKKIPDIMSPLFPLLAIENDVICIFMEKAVLSDKYKFYGDNKISPIYIFFGEKSMDTLGLV